MSHFCEKFWERVLLVLTHHTIWFISLGWNSLLLFFEEFASIIPFMAWFEMLTNSREEVTFSSLSLPVTIKQTYFFLKNLNVQSFSLCWSRWGNFESDPKFANNKICVYNQLCMYNHVHMFHWYANFIHFEKLYIYIYIYIQHIIIYIYIQHIIIYIYTYVYINI